MLCSILCSTTTEDMYVAEPFNHEELGIFPAYSGSNQYSMIHDKGWRGDVYGL